MNNHFYKGSAIRVVVSKPVHDEMYSILFVKHKGSEERLVYFYGNIGDSFNPPFISLNTHSKDDIQYDEFEIKRPHEIDEAYVCLFDKQRAKSHSFGRFAPELSNEIFRLSVINESGQKFESVIEGTLYSNLTGVYMLKDFIHGLAGKKFDFNYLIESGEVSTDDIWSAIKKSIPYHREII